jgi:hypothetical protein
MGQNWVTTGLFSQVTCPFWNSKTGILLEATCPFLISKKKSNEHPYFPKIGL